MDDGGLTFSHCFLKKSSSVLSGSTAIPVCMSQSMQIK